MTGPLTVCELWRYPVKSMAGERVAAVELEGRRRLACRGRTERTDDADHVLEQVAHRPFGARRLVEVLLGADAGDDASGVGEGLLQRIDRIHLCSDRLSV